MLGIILIAVLILVLLGVLSRWTQQELGLLPDRRGRTHSVCSRDTFPSGSDLNVRRGFFPASRPRVGGAPHRLDPCRRLVG
jgi:hypothetical protein